MGLLEVVMGLIYFPLCIESGRIPESGQKTLGNLSKRSKELSLANKKLRKALNIKIPNLNRQIKTYLNENIIENIKQNIDKNLKDNCEILQKNVYLKKQNKVN